MKTPYSDTYMTYDTESHRYVLTSEFVIQKMNINLGALLDTPYSVDISAESGQFLERISRMIYGYIYRVCPHRYERERALALEEALREPLMRAMEEQIRYVMFNGDLSLYCALDTHVAEASRNGEIAPLARDILASADIIKMAVPRNSRDIEPQYAREEY